MNTLTGAELETIVSSGSFKPNEYTGRDDLTVDPPSADPLMGDTPMVIESDGRRVQYFISKSGFRWAREVDLPDGSHGGWVRLS